VAYEFLSDDWFVAVDALREESEPPSGALADLVVNLRVTGAPAGDIESTLSGGLFTKGATQGAPTTVTVPYDVAKSMFVEGNPQVAMQAFMAGKIKVDGDMTKLMSLQTAGMDPRQQEIQKRLAALTA
jgi:hypothetical protein